MSTGALSPLRQQRRAPKSDWSTSPSSSKSACWHPTLPSCGIAGPEAHVSNAVKSRPSTTPSLLRSALVATLAELPDPGRVRLNLAGSDGDRGDASGWSEPFAATLYVMVVFPLPRRSGGQRDHPWSTATIQAVLAVRAICCPLDASEPWLRFAGERHKTAASSTPVTGASDTLLN